MRQPSHRPSFLMLLIVVVLTVPACSSKDRVGAITHDLRQVVDSLELYTRKIPRSLIGEASHAIEASLRPVLNSTVDSLLAIVQVRLDSIESDLPRWDALMPVLSLCTVGS